MKHLTSLLLSLLITFVCEAKNKLFITINVEDCSACISSMQYYFKDDYKDSFTIVLNEKYKNDATEVLNELGLNDYKANIIWSDERYEKLVYAKMQSSISVLDAEDNILLNYPLKGLSIENYHKAKALLAKNDTDGDALEKNDFKELYGLDIVSSSFQANEDHIVFHHSFKNKFTIYNRKEHKITDTIVLTDSILAQHYRIKFKQDVYADQIRELKKLGVRKLAEVYQYAIIEDTLTVTMGLKYYYLDTVRNDTIVDKISALLRYKDGKLIAQQNLNLTFFHNRELYFINGLLVPNFYKGNIYAGVVSTNESAYPLGKANSIALLSNKEQHIEKQALLDFKYPTLYKNDNNQVAVMFHKNYFTYYLEDKYYDLETGAVIDIDYLKNVNNLFTNTNLKVMQDFKVNGDYVWCLYYSNQDNVFKIYKYNRKTKQILYDKTTPLNYDHEPIFDEGNYDCILYHDKNYIIKQPISLF